MSSREISEMTGKPHNDLMKSIRKMEASWCKVRGGNFSLTYYETSLPNGGTRKDPEYLLNKIECLYIATKFNDEARAILINRWEELEQQQATAPNQLSRMDILNLAMEAEKENQQLRQVVEVQEKKLCQKSAKESFAEHITDEEKYILTATAIGSRLGISAKELNKQLLAMGIIRVLGDDYSMTSKYANSGYGKRIAMDVRNAKTVERLRFSYYGEAFIVDKIKGLDKTRYTTKSIPVTKGTNLIY
ncbi:Rha family transcriptional regulator [Sphingobacterium corticis]|uniref:Rha family transcriptional regulator n=2 Tax=Sphingobacterium corticis TaxID=1812823 RepID=A0ABW5NNM4_9SPHI